MAKKLSLVNGIPRMVDEGGSPTIYDKTISIVASSPGANQLQGPISAGTSITLPDSKSYTGDELQLYLNGSRLDDVFDYNHSSSTTIQMTFQLEVGDLLRFYIDRTF